MSDEFTILNQVKLCDGRTAFIYRDGIAISGGSYVHRFKKKLTRPVGMVIATPDGLYLEGKKVLAFSAPDGQGAIAYCDQPLVINNDNRTFNRSRRSETTTRGDPADDGEEEEEAEGRQRHGGVLNVSNGSVGVVLGSLTVVHHYN